MNIAIILAGGKGERVGLKENKAFLPLGSTMVLLKTLEVFERHKNIDEIVVVMNKESVRKTKKIFQKNKTTKIIAILSGGKNRQESVKVAFDYSKKRNPKVAIIHNAANPFVTSQEISSVIDGAKKYGAAFVGHKVADTLRYKKNLHATKISPLPSLDRENIVAAQTPQALQFEILEKGMKFVERHSMEVTDDVTFAEIVGITPHFIEASENNFKITTKRDYEIAKFMSECDPAGTVTAIASDSHKFDLSQKGLVLAGIKFPKHLKLKANSDGDVVLHAIATALSQALSEGSLGTIADPLFQKGITDSKKYLQPLLLKLKRQKYKISHLGIHFEGKNPKIDPIVEKLKKSLAKILSIKTLDIGITATSGEELSSFGKGQGLHCIAIVNLKKNNE